MAESHIMLVSSPKGYSISPPMIFQLTAHMTFLLVWAARSSHFLTRCSMVLAFLNLSVLHYNFFSCSLLPEFPSVGKNLGTWTLLHFAEKLRPSIAISVESSMTSLSFSLFLSVSGTFLFCSDYNVMDSRVGLSQAESGHQGTVVAGGTECLASRILSNKLLRMPCVSEVPHCSLLNWIFTCTPLNVKWTESCQLVGSFRVKSLVFSR